jgi:hypothetical protein
MGVGIDGSDRSWPSAGTEPVLPTFSPYQSAPAQYIEVFNRGTAPFDYRIATAAPWLRVDRPSGRVTQQVRATLSVDWARAPVGTTRIPVTVTGADDVSVVVQAVVSNPGLKPSQLRGFVEAGGNVSIQADHYTKAVGTEGVSWQRLPGIGRTGAGMEPWPVTSASRTPGPNGPRLEYTTTLTTTGPVDVTAYLSPRNSVLNPAGLRYAVSLDDAAPQIVNVTSMTGANDTTMNKQWERNTSDNVNRTTTRHTITRPGTHVLKFWMVDPTVVLQNLVLTPTATPTTAAYLGPPESYRAR